MGFCCRVFLLIQFGSQRVTKRDDWAHTQAKTAAAEGDVEKKKECRRSLWGHKKGGISRADLLFRAKGKDVHHGTLRRAHYSLQKARTLARRQPEIKKDDSDFKSAPMKPASIDSPVPGWNSNPFLPYRQKSHRGARDTLLIDFYRERIESHTDRIVCCW